MLTNGNGSAGSRGAVLTGAAPPARLGAQPNEGAALKLALVALALVLVACSSEPTRSAVIVLRKERPSHHVPTWLFWGASGVTGAQSNPAQLPTNYLGSGVNLQEPQAYCQFSSSRDGEPNLSWRDMAPGAERHGYEQVFAFHLRHSWGVAESAVILHSRNGTGLTPHWLNGPGHLAAALTRAQAELALRPTYYVAGLYLQIAARDANKTNAPLYFGALKTSIAAVRSAFGSDVAFIISRPSLDLGATTEVETVHDATDAYVLTDPNSIAINVDDLPFDGTGPHWLTPTIVEQGQRIAEAAATLYLRDGLGAVRRPESN